MFQDLIQQHYEKLTKSQKVVAHYVLEHPDVIALHAASEVGKQIGVSETTIIRFCYQLELGGYTDLQKRVQKTLVAKESSTLGTYLATNALREEEHFSAAVMLQDVERLQKFAYQINDQDFKQASKKLHAARHIYILGLRSSYAAAEWSAFTLNVVRQQVTLLRPEAQDVIHTISQMDERDVLLVFSFHRYYKQTIDLTKIIQRQGVHVIGITDSPLAPIRRYVNTIFPFISSRKSTIDMMPSILSFVNTLVIGMTAEDPAAYESYQSAYDAVDSSNLFLDGDDES